MCASPIRCCRRRFWAAVADAAAPDGFGGRTDGMRRLFGELLPDEIIERRLQGQLRRGVLDGPRAFVCRSLGRRRSTKRVGRRGSASGPLARVRGRSRSRSSSSRPRGSTRRYAPSTASSSRRSASSAESQRRRRRSWRNGSELSSMSSCGLRRVQPSGAMREQRRQPLRALQAASRPSARPNRGRPSRGAAAQARLARAERANARAAPITPSGSPIARCAAASERRSMDLGPRARSDRRARGRRRRPPVRRRARAMRAASSCPRPCRRAAPTLRRRRRKRPHGSSLGPASARQPPRRPRGEDEPAPDRRVAWVDERRPAARDDRSRPIRRIAVARQPSRRRRTPPPAPAPT